MADNDNTPTSPTGDMLSSRMDGDNQLQLKDADFSPTIDTAEFASWFTDHYGDRSVAAAMDQASFQLCVDIISQDVAKSTLRLRKRMENGTSKIVVPRQHPMAAMLAMEPNEEHTWYEFSEMTVSWLAMQENAYIYVVRDRIGNPVELIPVQPGRVQKRIVGRETFYHVWASTQQELALFGFTTKDVPARDMIHVRGRLLDGFDGFSTLAAGASTISSGKKITEYKDQIFGEDGQLRGVFTKAGDTYLPEDAFQRLRSQFKILMNRYRSLTEPIVLEGGMSFEKTSANPAEIELSKQMNAQIAEMGRRFRIPPHKLFLMDGTKYDNMETAEKIYVGDTLVPQCERIEQRLGRMLLSPEDRLDMFFEYDREEMTMQDSQRQLERVKMLVMGGVIEIDEARAEFGFNPLPKGAGQVRTIPTQMTVVDRDGNVLIGGASTATPDTAAAADAAPAPEAEPAKSVLTLVAKR